MEAGKPISRRYFRADGSFATEVDIVQEEAYERMGQAGELDKDSLHKGTLGEILKGGLLITTTKEN